MRCGSFLLLSLSFMFCWIAARADLTEADLVKISSMFDTKLDAKFDKLESKFDAKFDKLESDMGKLESKLDAKFDKLESRFDDLQQTLSKSFQRLYGIKGEQVDAMKSKPSCPLHPKGSGTRHALFYLGKIATVFTASKQCTNSDVKPSDSYIFHDKYDLALDTSCSTDASSALNITRIATPYLGDNLLSFGYGDDPFVWKGIISRLPSNTNRLNEATECGSESSRVCDGEIAAQGYHHEDMSGAPVLNGCGYVGMAHTPVSLAANVVGIIPAAAIREFVTLHLSKLPTVEECSKTVIFAPSPPFVDCSKLTSALEPESDVLSSEER